MRLRQVTVDNFRNFQEFVVTLEDFSVIIGANNVGKTNFLNALEYVFSSRGARYALLDKQDFRQASEPVVVEVVFEDLTDIDKAAFFHDQGLINPESNTITIRFESAWSSIEQDVWSECYFVRGDLPEEEQRITDFYPRFRELIPFFAIPSSRSATQEIGLSRTQDFGRVVRLFAADYLKPLETLRHEIIGKLDKIEAERENWRDFPGAEFDHLRHRTEDLLSIAENEVGEQVLRPNDGEIIARLDESQEKWTEIRDSLNEICDDALGEVLSGRLKDLLERVHVLFERCRAQLALCRLRDGMLDNPEFKRLEDEFDTVFGEILPSEQFTLDLFPIQDDELISQASIDVDGFPILGHGSGYQSIFVVGLKLMRTLSQLALTEGLDVRNFILAVEEPEAHLHPHIQRHLVNSLRRLQGLWSDRGYRLQVIITTHSPSVVSRVASNELIIFRGGIGRTDVVKWQEDELELVAKDLAPEQGKRGKKYNQLRAWVEFFRERYADVFFSNSVIVVEGETEAGAIPVWAGKLNPPVDCDRLGISVVCGEGSSLTYTLKILDRYGIDHTCLYDQGDEHRVVNATEGGLHPTEGDEFEDDVISSVRLSSIVEALGLVCSENSTRNRMGWVKGHIDGCEDLDNWKELSDLLGGEGLADESEHRLRAEALRWIKKSNTKGAPFGRALANVTTASEIPQVCRSVIRDAAKRAERRAGEENGHG